MDLPTLHAAVMARPPATAGRPHLRFDLTQPPSYLGVVLPLDEDGEVVAESYKATFRSFSPHAEAKDDDLPVIPAVIGANLATVIINTMLHARERCHVQPVDVVFLAYQAQADPYWPFLFSDQQSRSPATCGFPPDDGRPLHERALGNRVAISLHLQNNPNHPGCNNSTDVWVPADMGQLPELVAFGERIRFQADLARFSPALYQLSRR